MRRCYPERSAVEQWLRPSRVSVTIQCELVSGHLSGRRPAQFKCETQGLRSSGVSVTVDSLDPFQRR